MLDLFNVFLIAAVGMNTISASRKWNIHSRDRSASSGQPRYCRVEQLPESEWTLNREVPGVNMASKGKVESLTEEVTCPICLDFFTDPVILECGHNFCRSCITRCWEREERNSCPECRVEIADRTLKVNWALANLSEKARKLNLNPKGKESKLHCEEHEEELKLFCETDKTLICQICRDAREHKSHNVMPINEAAEIYKSRASTPLLCQFHGALNSPVLQKMIDLIFYHITEANVLQVLKCRKGDKSPVSVTLDVETASPELEVSEDRKSVRWTGNRMNLPDTGKKFTDRPCVLGSEGFTLGRHFWERPGGQSRYRRVRQLPGSERTLNPEVPGVNMASKGQVESLTEEVTCPICLDFFTDPVILECGHNFCRSCITRCWEREERNSCPECREEFADRTLKVNRALANLSEKTRKLNLNLKGKESKLHCEKHEEELKLFCETDKILICLICATAREHKSHNFMPVNEAAEIYKGRVKSSLDSLTKKKSDFEEMEQQQKEKISGVREQSHRFQSHITSHFAELRRVLTEKEQRALRDLREEEERILNPMEKNLREIQENLNSISDDTQTLSVTDGALLAEKFYHPYLFDTALGEALDSIKRVSVTLDVETASRELEVSEDRKRDLSLQFCRKLNKLFSPALSMLDLFNVFLIAAVGMNTIPASLKRNIHSPDCSAPGGQSRYRSVPVDNPGTAAPLSRYRSGPGGQSRFRRVRQLPESERILNPEVPGVNMASKGQVEGLTEEVTCPICLDFFTDPVILDCGHNFCRSCITRCWEREQTNSCPECREEFADRTLRVNRALANLSEKTRKLNLNPKEKESKLHCEKHGEELKLFCETDKTLICQICRDAREHKSHNFMPINEAAEIYKGRVKSSLDSLTKKKLDFEEMEQQQKEKISGVREQSHRFQSHITSHFAELRRIITEKEQRALRDLREEEEGILNPMEKNLREIQENLNSIQEEISKLQERMDQHENIMFLMEEDRQKRRVSDDYQTLSVTDGALQAEKFYHPYLFDTALGEALDSIKRVSVTLDVETAHPYLEVSEDRKSVRRTGTRRDLPDTGKRFTNWPCVLGSEGFTSGRHYWEVEMTGNRFWCLGVAAESVERKGEVRQSPETGFWVITRDGDVLHRDCDVVHFPFRVIRLLFPDLVPPSPESRLAADPIPRRVGVYLSYESGTVSFYNAETNSHLHTFTGNKFTEKLYPFFWTVYPNEWLRICSGSAPGL
ncbi:uncharacterized protein [Hemitrygon akajei]|uniref:uncharacterized protein n=1 Tax=Hemitrygon akajei TaxID=2704970 RepID=UPI003BFA20D9